MKKLFIEIDDKLHQKLLKIKLKTKKTLKEIVTTLLKENL